MNQGAAKGIMQAWVQRLDPKAQEPPNQGRDVRIMSLLEEIPDPVAHLIDSKRLLLVAGGHLFSVSLERNKESYTAVPIAAENMKFDVSIVADTVSDARSWRLDLGGEDEVRFASDGRGSFGEMTREASEAKAFAEALAKELWNPRRSEDA
jgi:hypothetical protein